MFRFNVLWVFLFCLPLQSYAQESAHLRKEIQKIVSFDTQHDFEKTPGFLIGLIIGDSSFVFPFGNLTEKDVHFEIGEVTQVFTATLLHQLEMKGALDLDTLLGEALQLDSYPTGITLRHCLQHNTGLPKHPSNFGAHEENPDDPYANYPRDALLDYFKNSENNTPQKYQFSNTNYALLELALEHLMRQPYDSLLEQNLLIPWELRDTGLGADTALAEGHNRVGKPTGQQNYQSFRGALGVSSNLPDLMAFLRRHIDNKPDWLQLLRTEAIPTGMREEVYAVNGWHEIRHKKYFSVFVATGATQGHRAYLAFVPETRTGVVVLSNAPFGMGGLGYLILRMLNNNWKLTKAQKKLYGKEK